MVSSTGVKWLATDVVEGWGGRGYPRGRWGATGGRALAQIKGAETLRPVGGGTRKSILPPLAWKAFFTASGT